MTKKIYYEKRGKRYYPVAEYDSSYIESYPKGTHLIMCYPGGTSRRFNVDPNYAAMIAAGRVAEDTISMAIVRATDIRPSKKPLTKEQIDAWHALSESFGEESHALSWPSARSAATEAVDAMMKEAAELMENEAVKKAFDHFQLVCKLTKEATNKQD